jgi:crotonobetainyl-CoA:carnitine CoA-transferase CaiB-like acyl-CoA transferase
MDLAGVPGGPINTLDKVFADAQVAARGMVREFCPDDGSDDGPADGPADAPILRLTRFPALLSETPATIRDLPAPRIGAHTRQVLTSMGLGTDEIAALAQAGVLAGD